MSTLSGAEITGGAGAAGAVVAGALAADETRNSLGACFVPYRAQRFTGGFPHPAPLVESASMAAVVPPPITYRPHLDPEIIRRGLLSDVQLERVCYAGQRHSQRLPNGARGGFNVGDGTGVGKGRELAAIVVDNWNQGRRRAVHFSVNNDLLEAARRDLDDLLASHIPLARIGEYDADDPVALGDGVLFCSYSSLISKSKKGRRRFDQIVEWLGRDGVVLFDEGHRAKNALQSGRGEPTQTGLAVIELQDAELYPDFRVVYSSATGASEVRNLAYMVRLSLWGVGTAFEDFTEFSVEIEGGGTGAMEMVCRDMRALGLYASASISFEGVEYGEVFHKLTPRQRRMYNDAARAWQVVLQNIDKALDVTNASARAKANAYTAFWGRQQAFFRVLISAFKVPTVIKEAEAALKRGESPVITLVGTGESKTRQKVSKAIAEGDSLEDLDFSPREIICAMVARSFPTTLYTEVEDKVTKQKTKVVVKNKKGDPVESREAVRLKQRVLDSLSGLELPENPLDQIINSFGESAVAEITGRKRRLIRDRETGRMEYRKRVTDGVSMARMNVHETEMFQAGEKLVAVISDAGSVGISLHSDRRAANQRRRCMITLEFGWSADKQLQTFGRVHRSNQAFPPRYILVSTELGGERRFSSTIARRLGSLGALTKGDRNGADGSDLGRYNFETQEGEAALSMLFARIVLGRAVPGLDDPKQALRDMGLLREDSEGAESVKSGDESNVPRFLNRVLALDVDRQNAMFDFFAGIFDETVEHAKQTGTFDDGVEDIKALAVRVAGEASVVAVDPTTGAQTRHYRLELDLPNKTASFERAEAMRGWRRGSGYFRNTKTGGFVLACPCAPQTDPKTGRTHRNYAITKPEGERRDYVHESDLAKRFTAVEPEEARGWWETHLATLPEVVTVETHIISGAILRVWHRLKTKEGTRLKVVRVSTDAGERVVGVQIPEARVAQVLRSLGLSRSPKTAEEIFRAVLASGETVALEQKFEVRRVNWKGDAAIEVKCADHWRMDSLRRVGLINERDADWRQRFFVPAEPEEGLPVMEALLKLYPAVSNDDEVAEAAAVRLAAESGKLPSLADEGQVIHLPAFFGVEIETPAGAETAAASTPEPAAAVEVSAGEADESAEVAAAAEAVTPDVGEAAGSAALTFPAARTRRARGRREPDPAQITMFEAVWGGVEALPRAA